MVVAEPGRVEKDDEILRWRPCLQLFTQVDVLCSDIDASGVSESNSVRSCPQINVLKTLKLRLEL